MPVYRQKGTTDSTTWLDMDEKLLDQAKAHVENAEYGQAYRIIEEALERGDAEAQFLYSSFSIDERETHSEFEARTHGLIESAALKGLPDALYVLGVLYDTGDGVKRDTLKASELFKRAAEGGHSRAKLSYGLDLYNGLNNIARNKALGLRYITEAANENVEDAKRLLSELKE